MNTKTVFCLTALALSLSNFAARAETKYVRDPMKYSEDYSKFFAEGDSNDSSGWGGCGYADSDTDTMTRIYCIGNRDILVHGGTMVGESFNCDFIFSGNLIVSENCH